MSKMLHVPGRVTTSIAQVCTEAQLGNNRVPGPCGWYPAWVPWYLPKCAVAVRGDKVVLNGFDVSTFVDQTYQGRDLVQATASKQPLYVASGGPGNRAYVEFDGVDEFVRGTWTWNQPEHVFAVLVPSVSEVANEGIYDGSASSAMFAYVATSTQIGGYAGSGFDENAGGTRLNTWSRMDALWNGASSRIRRNGVSKSGNYGANNAGGLIFGMRGNQTTNPGDPRIAEFVGFTAEVTGIPLAWIDWYQGVTYYPQWWQPILNLTPKVLLIDGVGQFTDAGVTPAVVGDAVYQWSNLADAANPAVQATAGNRPDRDAAGLHFDGAADFMAIAGFDNVGNDCTVVAVVDVDANTGIDDLVTVGGVTAHVLASTNDSTNTVGGYDLNALAWRAGMPTKTGRQVLAWRWTSGTTLLETYRDGVKLGQATYSGTITTKTGLIIGADLALPTALFDGKLLSLVVFNSSLSDANLAIVHREMLARYSLVFDRASVAGLITWLRPDTGYVTLNGADVSAVADRAATPHNLSQAVAGEQPAYEATGGPNGTPCITHDGVDETLASTAFTVAQPMQLFAVLKPHVAQDGNYSSFVSSLNSGNEGWHYYIWGASLGIYSSTNLGTGGGAANNTWMRIQCAFNGASSNITKNGTSLATANAGAVAPITNGYVLGKQTGSGRFFDGSWAEMWEYNRVLNTYEIAANDALTLARYGL